MIRVMIADDQMLIRQSIKIVLESEAGNEIVVTGMAGDGIEVLNAIDTAKPDIILMDIRMPRMDGVQCTKQVKEQHPEIRIIILTTFDDDEYVYDALRFGASGYLLKGINTEELVRAIRIVDQGQAMLNPDIEVKVLKMFSEMTSSYEKPAPLSVKEEDIDLLTENEWKIIREVTRGLSNKEISESLNFSTGTVRNYLSTILDKLELRDRTQLAIWAVQRSMR